MRIKIQLLIIIFLLAGYNFTQSQDFRDIRGVGEKGYIPVFWSKKKKAKETWAIVNSEMYYEDNLGDTTLKVAKYPLKLTEKLLMANSKNTINLFTPQNRAVLDINHEYPSKNRLVGLLTIIDDEGKALVGIGNDTPSANLDVNGSIKTKQLTINTSNVNEGDILMSENTNGDTRWVDSQNIAPWEVDGNNVFYAPGRSGVPGDVGINTLSPDYALDVDGIIRVTENLIVGSDGSFSGDLSVNGSFTVSNATINQAKLGGITMKDATFGIYYNGSYLMSLLGDTQEILLNGSVTADNLTVSNTATTDNLTVANNSTIEGKLTTNELDVNNDVRIGPNNEADLTVNGIVTAKEVVVRQNVWSDHVFNDKYELQSLEALEDYINNHNHLPGIPDEKTIKEKGINVSEMNAKLMEKIEELTLYTIKQQKVIKSLKKEIEKLQKSNNTE